MNNTLSAALTALLEKLGKTERRVSALRDVHKGIVDWAPDQAAWLVEGQPQSGWDYRTFAELRKVGAVKVSPAPEGDVRHSIVELTPGGLQLLAYWA